MKTFTEFLTEATSKIKTEFQKVFSLYNSKMKKTRGVELYYVTVYDDKYGVFIVRTNSKLLELGFTYQLDSIVDDKTKEPIISNATKMANGLVFCLENEDGLKFITKALSELDKTGDYDKFIKSYREHAKPILAYR